MSKEFNKFKREAKQIPSCQLPIKKSGSWIIILETNITKNSTADTALEVAQTEIAQLQTENAIPVKKIHTLGKIAAIKQANKSCKQCDSRWTF